MSETLSIKVSPSEKAHLRALAEARNVSVSTLIREGLEKVLAEADSCQPSCFELNVRYFEEPGHLGSSGLGNLSTDKSRLQSFGRKK